MSKLDGWTDGLIDRRRPRDQEINGSTDQGRLVNTFKSFWKSGVPNPVTGSQPFVAANPFVPQPGLSKFHYECTHTKPSTYRFNKERTGTRLTSNGNIMERLRVLVLVKSKKSMSQQTRQMPSVLKLTKTGLTNPIDFLPFASRASLISANMAPTTGVEALVP